MEPASFFRTHSVPQGEPLSPIFLPHMSSTPEAVRQAFTHLQGYPYRDPFYNARQSDPKSFWETHVAYLLNLPTERFNAPVIQEATQILQKYFPKNDPEAWRLFQRIVLTLAENNPGEIHDLIAQMSIQHLFDGDAWARVDTILERLLLSRIQTNQFECVFLLRCFRDRPLPTELLKQLFLWVNRSPELLARLELRKELIRLPQFPLLWTAFSLPINSANFQVILKTILQIWPDIKLNPTQQETFHHHFQRNPQDVSEFIDFVHFYPDFNVSLPTLEELENHWDRISFCQIYWLVNSSQDHLKAFVRDIKNYIGELRTLLDDAGAYNSWQETTSLLKILALLPAHTTFESKQSQHLKYILRHCMDHIPEWEKYSGRFTYELILCLAHVVDKLENYPLARTYCNYEAAFEMAFMYAASSPDRQIEILEALATLLKRYPKLLSPNGFIAKSILAILHYPWAPMQQARIAHALANLQETHFAWGELQKIVDLNTLHLRNPLQMTTILGKRIHRR